MEDMVAPMFDRFFMNKRVFVTGHTGFKGGWLCLWLHALGADVTGYALDPPTEPSLFGLCRVGQLVNAVTGDVRDAASLQQAMQKAAPEIVIHMAAQAIVRDSYQDPMETYAVNLMGTVHLLEAVRRQPGVKAVIVVTSDKCYENREWVWGYRENEPLGGHDPYSSSKACAELAAAAYRHSFFRAPYPVAGGTVFPHVATARAGNVIGGGDWAKDRLIPDCIRTLTTGQTLRIRNPAAVRPWQHVLEPLAGYLMLAQRLAEDGAPFAEAWNFGSRIEDTRPVGWIVQRFAERIPGFSWERDLSDQPHEANVLRLDSAKAAARLGWRSRWPLETALEKTMAWYEAWQQGQDMRDVSLRQIADYEKNLEQY